MRASLYIHFPFCLKKCLYCDFNSSASRGIPPEAYVSLLLKEMQLHAATLSEPVTLTTLYFGGGTPSLMAPELVQSLIDAAARLFRVEGDAEITLEANPGTLTYQRLSGYRRAGVNRLSLGFQAFEDRLLQRMGRVHTVQQAREAFAAARRAGFDNVSIDLIHSLPGQSLQDWEEALREAVLLEPEHVSAYALSVESGTPFAELHRRGELPLPEEEEGAQMFEATAPLLARGGLEQYEISNFARPGRASRHNGTYWSRGSYFGFGAGAHSFCNRDGIGVRWENLGTPESYRTALEAGRLPREERHQLTLREAVSESFFLGLRRLEGVDLEHLTALHGEKALAEFLAQAEKLTAAGLLLRSGNRIRLAPAAIIVANTVFSRFL